MTGNNPSGSAPERVNSSVWHTPVAFSSTKTSPALGPSRSTVSITSGWPFSYATAARVFMARSSARVRRREREKSVLRCASGARSITPARMSGKWRRWCGVLGGLGLAVGCARGAVPEYPPIVQVERVAITEQAPVRLLSVRYEYVFDEQGNWREHLRQSYRILNQQGVETWGGAAAGWSPWYMARPELEAQVRDPGGALRKLDLSAVAEAPAHPDLPDIYGDRRV